MKGRFNGSLCTQRERGRTHTCYTWGLARLIHLHTPRKRGALSVCQFVSPAPSVKPTLCRRDRALVKYCTESGKGRENPQVALCSSISSDQQTSDRLISPKHEANVSISMRRNGAKHQRQEVDNEMGVCEVEICMPHLTSEITASISLMQSNGQNNDIHFCRALSANPWTNSW